MSKWWRDWWARFGTPAPEPRRGFHPSPARGGHTDPPTWQEAEATLTVFTLLRAAHGEADWTVDLLFYAVPANQAALVKPPFPRRRIQAALDRLVASGWVEPYLVTGTAREDYWAYRIHPDRLPYAPE